MAESNFAGFSNYKQTIIELTGDLNKLKEYSAKLDLTGNAQSVGEVVTRLTEDTFNVAILGEFNRGKSTLINALLGKSILPMNFLPTTAALNKIVYSVTPFARVVYRDGKQEEIEVEKLVEYVTKLSSERQSKAATVKEAVVFYPVNYCKNGVTIIDTPGLNDESSMQDVTFSVLPQTDAAVMVIMANVPFSQSEREFLENKLMASDLGQVLFVVTGIDAYDEDEAEQILTHIRGQIEEHVLIKAANTFGKQSTEYENYVRKLGKIRVFGLSARDALKAKMKGDDEMLKGSRFPAFEDALERFLTEDRGAIMLNVPINRVKTAAVEILKAAALRESALSMEKDAFDKRYEEAAREIEDIKRERQKEFNVVTESMRDTVANLKPLVSEYWPKMEAAADEVIDMYPITAGEISGANEATAREALTKAVSEALSATAQNQSERIQQAIGDALSDEADRLASFETHFYEATERVQGLFVEAGKGGGSDTAVGTLLNAVGGVGIGGIYMGFKQSGWKGALLGGATSIAGTLAGGFGAGLLIGALAIPFTWPVLLAATGVSAIIGAFTTKWSLNKVFGKDKVERYKTDFKSAVHTELAKMKAEDNISANVQEQIQEAFDALKAKVRTETDRILSDTQAQLTKLKVDFAQAEKTREQQKIWIKDMLEDVNNICDRASKLGSQMADVLSRI